MAGSMSVRRTRASVQQEAVQPSSTRGPDEAPLAARRERRSNAGVKRKQDSDLSSEELSDDGLRAPKAPRGGGKG